MEEISHCIVSSANIWSQLECFQVCEALGLDEVEVLAAIEILLIWFLREEQIVVWAIVLIIIILWDPIVNRVLLIKTYCSFVSPASRNVLDRVATAAEDEQGETPRLHLANAGSVTLDGTIVSS